MNRPVSLGFIGPGIAARDLHWPALQQMKDKFVVKGVAGRSLDNSKRFAELVGGAQVYADYHELLKNDEIEAVSICVPFELNARITEDAIKAGKHVILEKPLAATLAEGERLVKLAAKSKQVTMVAENWRYRGIFLEIKKRLDAGVIGKPLRSAFSYVGKLSTNNKYFEQSTWRLTDKNQAILLLDGGVHFVAAMRLLFGKVKGGFGTSTMSTLGLNKADSLAYHFNFESGVYGTLNFFLNSIGYSSFEWIVWGTQGTLVSDQNLRRLRVLTAEKELTETLEETDEGYRAQFEDFFASIRQGAVNRSSFEEGWQDMKVILESMPTGRA